MSRWNRMRIGAATATIVVLATGGFFAARTGSVDLVLDAQSTSIGWVDMQRALAGHPKYPSAEAALGEYARAQIADMRERMTHMTPAQTRDLQARVNQAVFSERTKLYGSLDKDVRVAVQEVAAERRLGTVLQWNAVLYGGTDLTDNVITVLRSGPSPRGRAGPVASPMGIGRTRPAPLLLIVCALAGGCGLRAGVVDTQRVLNESVTALQYQKQLNDRQKELMAELSSVQGQISPAELNARRARVSDELSQMSYDFTGRFNAQLRQVAARVAHQDGLGLIVVARNTFVGGRDVTQQVIDLVK